MNNKNISQVLKFAYENYPEKNAVHLLFSNKPEQTLSYRDLLEKSALFSISLHDSDIQPGEVVIIILQHSQELLFSFFGAVLRGCIPSIMPFLTEKLSPDQYRKSLEALFTITKPSAIITYSDFLPEVLKASAGTSIRKIFVSEIVFTQEQSVDYQKKKNSDFWDLGGINRSIEDIALLQHSSGTTGLQKGVALSHQAVFNQLDSYTQVLNFTQQDVIASWLPLYHDMGLIAGFLMPLLTGASLVLMSPFDWVRAPYRLLQAISRYKATFCWLPNFAYNFCAQKIRDRDLEGVDLSGVKAFINCSEPIHWKSHLLFWQRYSAYGLKPTTLCTSYAMAENVFAVTQSYTPLPVLIDHVQRKAFSEKHQAIPATGLIDQADFLQGTSEVSKNEDLLLVSAGRPIPGTQIKILDADGNRLPDRSIGEIAIHSDYMLSGYYQRPDLTEAAFRDGWYLTGDLGYLVKNELFVTGRKKDLIIVGGKNIYPQDLESLAGEVEGVYPGRVVAFGVFDEQLGTEDIVLVAEIDLDAEDFSTKPEIKEKIDHIASEIRQHHPRL